MKTLLLSTFIMICLTANATTYYFSASGNDANNGTTSTTAWQSISKFNTVFASKSPGDNFLFNRGDVFYGQMLISRSGSSGSPITIGAYGSGANPVITGFTSVAAWTNLGSNIWESSSAVSPLSTCNMVTVNGTEYAMGRYPNTGFLIYQSFSGNTSITSSSLNSATTNWTGAEAVIKKQHWILDRNIITAHSGGTLTYTSGSTYNGQANWGFFIQNDPRTLDTLNEWYYNPSTKKLRVYETSVPANVQLSTVDTLVYIRSKSYVNFNGIDITGANKDFIQISADHISITNCNFNFSGKDGIWGATNAATSTNFVFQNNTMNHVNNVAINLETLYTGALISGNTIKNTGVLPGMGENGSTNYGMYQAMRIAGAGSIVQNNEVDSSGYVGIGYYGNNTIVQNNSLNTFCLTLDDGAGIYSWVGNPSSGGSGVAFTGEKIINNTIMNGVGTNAGTTDTGTPVSHGLYFDDWTANTEAYGNTISGNSNSGIYIHNAHNLNIHNNTLFNNSAQQILFASFDAGSPIRNINFKNNIVVSKGSAQYVATIQSSSNDISSFGTIDSNYWARPIDDNVVFNLQLNNYSLFLTKTLATWQSYTGLDMHSSKSPKAITTTNDIQIQLNITPSPLVVALNANYIDVKDTSYNGTITLSAYVSAVLIKNGTIANIPPVANAGADSTIMLPLNSTNVLGSGTDVDGTISAYAWTKISGPSSYTITNANSAATSITGLIQGVYQFQLKVTDNSGAAGLDTVQVTVNAAKITPTVNAGVDQSITLPTNTSALDGTAKEVNGIIRKYQWTKISGPTVTIVLPTSRFSSINGLSKGTYQFQLTVTDNNGVTASDTMQIVVNTAVLGSAFGNAEIINSESKTNKNVVYQNFPNPVTSTTTIRYEVANTAPVKIIVFNASGIQVGMLANEIKQPGSYQVQWNASNFPSGYYIYTVIIGTDVTSKKMLKIN